MYIWNGSMWEKRLDTEDVARVKREVDTQFEAVNTKMAGIEAKHDQKVTELLKKSNATQELAETSKRLAQEAKNASNSTGQELSRYKQDNEQNLSILRTQTTQVNGKAEQALNKANQTAAETSSLIANLRTDLNGKVSLADFQSVRETSKLYERILGSAENDVSNNVSRMIMSNRIFQTEVGKYVIDDNNLVVNSETLYKNTTSALKKGVSIVNNNGIFTIDINGLTSVYWGGFTLPIYVPKILKGEVYTLGFKYRILRQLDDYFRVTIKNHIKNK